MMKVLIWALRLVIFLFLFAFAAQNTEPVSLRLGLSSTWQAPLVIILLLFFAVGALLGMLSLLSLVFTQRREIARLKRQQARPLPAAVEPPPTA